MLFCVIVGFTFLFFFSGDLRKCRLCEFVAGSSPLLFPGTLGTLGFQGYLLMAVSHGFQIESHVVAMLGISNIAS